jgi:hypothetical protein
MRRWEEWHEEPLIAVSEGGCNPVSPPADNLPRLVQRHEEPKQATEEYEVGTYVYFDFNIVHDGTQSGWCYRLKQARILRSGWRHHTSTCRNDWFNVYARPVGGTTQ